MIEITVTLLIITVILAIPCAVIAELILRIFRVSERQWTDSISTALVDKHMANEVLSHPLLAGFRKKQRLAVEAPVGMLATALVDIAVTNGIDPGTPEHQQFRSVVRTWEHQGDEVDSVRVVVENWFTALMNLSLAKFRVQRLRVILAIALMLSVGANFRPLFAADFLWRGLLVRDLIHAEFVTFSDRDRVVTRIGETADSVVTATTVTKSLRSRWGSEALDLPLGWSTGDSLNLLSIIQYSFEWFVAALCISLVASLISELLFKPNWTTHAGRK